MTSVRLTVRQPNRAEHDVVVGFEDGATVADLASGLGGVGLRLPRTLVDGRPVASSARLQEIPVSHGSVVSAEPNLADPLPGPGTYLLVVSGPEAGAWFELPPGRPVRIGRTEGDITLPADDLLSRAHVELTVGTGTVVVRDLGSSNGTLVEGELIADEVEVRPHTYLHVGSSVLTVAIVEDRDAAVLGAPEGPGYAFPRAFREARPELRDEIRLPRRPSTGDDSTGSMWWRALIPLVAGAAFAILQRNPIYLLIVALGPIIYAVDAWRRKRRTDRRATENDETWAKNDAAAREEFLTTWQEERRRVRTANPMGGTATLYASLRHRRLWERRPGDEDFTCVTVGLAPQPSQVVLNEPGREDGRPERASMWGTPVSVNLLATGSLAVLGDRDRARAVVRGMLLGLAVTHSPGDLRIWVVARDGADEWGSTRWLPHAMQDDEVCQVASTLAARGSLVSTLRQIVDQRREDRRSASDPVPGPVHVVVFDGADVAPGRDFTEVLLHGPAHGVIGVVVDPSMAPDGIMGSLVLGRAADEAVFESRAQPRIERVHTAEMAERWAEPAARRLACLRPASGGALELTTSARLADLVGSDAASGGTLAATWAESSGRTRVEVGTVADATFDLDVARDGPHGLVGGMTRSGKTEFLKTLITSLAWANHPDDLCFVIVDFKGGIDYQAARELPHVLEVTSNQDLDRFERTIRLLSAELERRQRCFQAANVANLDAYRIGRTGSPSLPPVPRLVVLVDEFGEMLSSDIGREHLRQLESVARIGGALGVHLLLITQNFEGQLPEQISANAGMRVCFRVQDQSHSRVVLGSGVAASLPASAKGRGYARLQGADPVEFQSARVAGRRPDLASGDTTAVVRLQPFDSLTVAFRDSGAVDVPTEATDMHRIFGVIRDAARASGWSEPAVPWPSTLTDDLPLAEVIGRTGGESFEIALADLPDRQTQEPFGVRPGDDHLALLGGPRGDLASVLVTIACSMAASRPPDSLHLYGIDFTGRGLARLDALPHCGGIAARSDSLAVRIVRHLLDEAAFRRSELAAHGVATLDELEERVGIRFPHVVLLVAGAEKLTAAGNHEEPGPVAPLVARLLDEAAGLGIQVIAAGLPHFGSYRPGNLIDRRIVFAAADVDGYVSLGCPRSLLSELGAPRRGVDVASRTLIQVASLAAGEASEADVLDALVHRLRARWSEPGPGWAPRFVEVGWPMRWATVADRFASPARGVGLGIDLGNGELVSATPGDVGRSWFVAGRRRTGRTNALVAIGLGAVRAGWNVLATSAAEDGPFAAPGCPLPYVPLADLRRALDGSPAPSLVLVDDAHRLERIDPTPSSLDEADLVIFAGTLDLFGGLQRAVTATGAEKAGFGVVLVPEGPADLELLGVSSAARRSESFTNRRAGQGFTTIDGQLTEIVVPLVDSWVEADRAPSRR